MPDPIIVPPGDPARPARTNNDPNLDATLTEPTGTAADLIGTGDDDDLSNDAFAASLMAAFEDRAKNSAGQVGQAQMGDDQQDGGEEGDDETPREDGAENPPGEPGNEPLVGTPEQQPDPNATPTEGQDAAQQALAWLNSLTPEQAQVIDAVLSGQARVLPANDPYFQQQAPVTQQPVTPAQPDPTAALYEELEQDNPALAAHLRSMQEELATLRQSQSQEVASRQQQEQIRLAAIADEAATEFTTAYTLTSDQMDKITTQVIQSALVPALSQRYPSDPKRAFREALEYVYWQDPDNRAREVDRRLEAERAASDELAARRVKASAVAGSGGSVSRETTPRRMTKTERDQQMVAEIAAEMGRGNG